MTLYAQFTQFLIRVEIMRYLVTFSGMAESKKMGSVLSGNGGDITGSSMGQGGSGVREEEDDIEKTTRMEEDESLLDESEGDQDEDQTLTKEPAKKSSSSVSALVNTFLKVRVGSNNVFENGGHNTSTINIKNPSVRVGGSQGNTLWLGQCEETGWQPPRCLALGHWLENLSVSPLVSVRVALL